MIRRIDLASLIDEYERMVGRCTLTLSEPVLKAPGTKSVGT
jgi:hypothetical protein